LQLRPPALVEQEGKQPEGPDQPLWLLAELATAVEDARPGDCLRPKEGVEVAARERPVGEAMERPLPVGIFLEDQLGAGQPQRRVCGYRIERVAEVADQLRRMQRVVAGG